MALSKTHIILVATFSVLAAVGIAVGLYFWLKPDDDTVVDTSVAAFANFVLSAQKNAFPAPLVGSNLNVTRTATNDLLLTLFQPSTSTDLPFVYPVRSFYKAPNNLPLFCEINTQYSGDPLALSWSVAMVEHKDSSTTNLFTGGFNTALSAAQVTEHKANEISVSFVSFSLKDLEDDSVSKIVWNSVTDGSLPSTTLYDPRTTLASNQTFGVWFDLVNATLRVYQNNVKLGEVNNITFTKPPYTVNSLALYVNVFCLGDGASATFSLNMGQNTFVNTVGNDGTTSNLFANDNLSLL